MKDGTLMVLSHMLDRPEMIRPWQVASLARELEMPDSTVYRHLRKLRACGLVKSVPAGYVLGDKVLAAGIKFKNQLAKLADPSKFKELEKILYG